MRRVAVLLLALSVILSCKNEEIPAIIPKLKNCRVEYLFFRDEIMMSSFESYSFPYNDSQKSECSYLYDDEKMVKLTGGFLRIPNGANFSAQVFSKDVYDSIDRIGGAIYVNTKYMRNGVLIESSSNPIIFNMDSRGKLVKVTKKDQLSGNGFDLNYTYSENQINETYSDGRVRRKFYFEQNNLIKVVAEAYDLQGLIFGKKEILFQDFDDKPNPFKNMYFVKGAFFRAFSVNNYKSYTTSEYTRSSDGTLVLTSKLGFSIPISYNTDGYPMFGDYE